MSLKKCKPEFEKIWSKYSLKNQALLPCLYAAQEKCGSLSEEVISFLAQELGLPKVEVYSVVTFYSMFSLEKQGRFIIRVCVSLPCHLKGSAEILKAIKEELSIETYQTTADGKFTIEPVSCLGLCGTAPAIMINKKAYGNLTPEKTKEIIREYRKKSECGAKQSLPEGDDRKQKIDS
ncbi:MAG: NAD(P)H-dependent oxidoreductase subunit E [Candidatus Omnitrophota bacterium]|nr:NAD(P)H-dependent oxidoreductase subunit E [Candidatus Omnitrophota bacterium]